MILQKENCIFCYFHSSFPELLVQISRKQRFALQEMLRCVSCRLTDYFVVRSFAAIVAEIVDCVTQVGGAWREHNCFCIMTFARKVRPYTWENTIFVTKLCTQNNRCFTSQFVGLVAKAEGFFFHCNYCNQMSRNEFALCTTCYKMRGLVHFLW